jgi:DNA invertase Pin-like site-specific DNA recombinase
MMGMSITGVYQCVQLMDARVALGKNPIPPTPLNKKGEPSVRKRWTQEEKDRVRELLQDGHDPITVAAIMDAPKLGSIVVWKGEWGL